MSVVVSWLPREVISVHTEQKTIAAGPVEPNGSIDELFGSFYRVRAAAHDLLAMVGADPGRTRESARVLGLNRQLVWRLSRIVLAAEPGAVLSKMPGRQGMAKFFAACRDRGADPAALQEADEAFRKFERAIDAISGDRRSLAALMANQGEGMPASALERERRKLFEGGRAVWGVQAKVRFLSVFLFPAPDDESMMDVAHVIGYVGFRRLRAIPWPMSYEAVRTREGAPMRFEKRPLEPRGNSEGQRQLLAPFCDPPDPVINLELNGDMKRFELAPGRVGNAGAATVVFGTYLRHLYPRVRTNEHLAANFIGLLDTPVERVIFDMFAHRDIAAAGPTTAYLCEKLTHPHPPADSEFEPRSLPIGEEPFALGRGAAGALSAHIPWYQRLVSFVCKRIGHPPEAFSGSRFEMTYPPIPTALVRGVPLPGGRSRK